MTLRGCLLFAAIVLAGAFASAAADPLAPMLRAYGPGGPHHALEEAAELYRQRYGVAVGVFKAGPVELARKLREVGDIYFGGAEYMLEEFASENPGLLDMTSVEKLYPRRIGILVRKGNPLNIEGVDCLAEEGVDLLAAGLEKMEPFLASPGNGRPPVRKWVFTGQDGAKAWLAATELDAWVTYKSWHVSLLGESEFIPIPGDHALRYTMLALTRRTTNRPEALRFFNFLKSPDARRIFVEHGWD